MALNSPLHLSILYSVFKSLQLLSAAVAARLALQIHIALIPQLVASHQHLNEIPDTLGVGAGVPAEAFAGVNQRWQHPNWLTQCLTGHCAI
jgi:hypothetical protein